MNTGKTWDRPWSTQEIIENSENWSLAGDAALLNSIKAFANNLLSKTDALSDDINNLLHNVDEIGLKLDISQNEFQSLKNTQFIESRVYDDDEALDSKEDKKVPEASNPDKTEEIDFNVSLDSEIALLDKYYETVEISISDSEDESERSFVLKPKDIYHDRQLPPLIGSDYWYKNWYIEDEFSDADSQKSSEIYSESDSDDNLPKDLFNGSETSSELDFSHQPNESRPVANSTFKDSQKPDLDKSSEDSDDLNSLPAKDPISNKNFAEQLAAKLDSVISKEENLPEENNTKPILPSKTDPFSAGLFSNEPPPLSDPEDKTMKGIFSGGKNLFDDDDGDSLFWDDQKKPSLLEHKKSEIDDKDSIKEDKRYDLLPKTSQISKGLFDSDNSDEDLFASKPQNINKPTFLQPNKPIVPLFDDEPPILEDEKKIAEPVKKKPVGGISIFGNQDMGDILKNRQQNMNKNEEIAPTSEKIVSPKLPKTNKMSIFDDDDEDFFSKMDIKPKIKKLNLFDDDVDNNFEPENNNKISDLEKRDSSEKIRNAGKKGKVLNLFDDDESNDIFNNRDTKIGTKTVGRHKNVSLFSDEDDINENSHYVPKNENLSMFDEESNEKQIFEPEIRENTKNVAPFEDSCNRIKEKSENNDPSLFDDTKTIQEKEKPPVQPPDPMNKETKKLSLGKTKKISLFEDDDEDEDDIFSNVTKKLDFKLFEDPESADDLFTIKKSSTSEDNRNENIKKAEIMKTSDVIKKGIENDKENCLQPSLEEEIVTLDADIDKEDSSTLKDTRSSPEHEEISKKKENKPAKLLPKPQLFEESFLPSTIKSVSEIPPIFEEEIKAITPPPRPVVSLFGSTPPPVDEEWETKSDNFSDTEDFLSYRVEVDEGSQRSNLFDNEPPSLNGYESSGIVKDHSNTRIDTDDSSFNPYASSSRRLSSDIFSDQQSQDSFFVTKNKTESVTNPSHLHIIPEDTKMTTIDVTPSGEFEESSTAEGTPNQNDSSSSDGVFLDKNTPDSSLDDEKKEKSDTDTPSEVKERDKSAIGKPKLEISKSVPNFAKTRDERMEKGITKIASITEMLKKQSPKSSPEKKVSPGKLKPTLNINVNALLPGFPQPKIKKAQNSDQSKDADDTKSEKSSDSITTPVIKTEESPGTSDLSPGLDVTDNVNILHSITKERVRNPAKRRPSTRRGRQEALRASVILDTPSEDGNTSKDEQKQENPDHTVKPSPSENSKLEGASIKEETPKDTEKPLEIPRLPIETKTELENKIGKRITPKNHLFDSDSESDVESDLFKSTKSKKSTEDRSKDLFGTSDEKTSKIADDLFGDSEEKTESTRNETLFQEKSIKDQNKSKKSLFDDSSSDDDLFSTSGSIKGIKKSESVKPVEKKAKPTIIKKLENIETEEDPLSSFLK